ncbi:MAG TPA: hypothetical protein VI365_24355, partial [Trebonia sp.]
LNGLINPPGAPPGNGGTPYDDVWSGNAYYGPWSWTAYLFGSCYPVPTDFITGNSMPLSGACTPNFSQWQGLWDQDRNSTFNPSLLTRTYKFFDVMVNCTRMTTWHAKPEEDASYLA